jgi:hypothetical protein
MQTPLIVELVVFYGLVAASTDFSMIILYAPGACKKGQDGICSARV